MGYCPLVAQCLPLTDLHHSFLTKESLKLTAPSSQLERHLHFASLDTWSVSRSMLLSLLFYSSIPAKAKADIARAALILFLSLFLPW